MSLVSSPIDDREWHVLMQGARHGPLCRAELRALLETHPERWNASVWRPGMLDWRPAGSIRALGQGASSAEPLWVRPGAPLEDPPRASTRAPRDESGELRVLSYEQRAPSERAPSLPVASPMLASEPESTDPVAKAPANAAVSGERAVVVTSELFGGARSELFGGAASGPASRGALEPDLATTGEWSLVVTSELRAISAGELRALALKQSGAAATVSELRAIPKELLLREAPQASMVLSEPTRMELPSFRFVGEQAGAAALVPEAGPAMPPALPKSRRPAPAPPRRFPLRALPLVLGGLVLLSALALLLIRLR